METKIETIKNKVEAQENKSEKVAQELSDLAEQFRECQSQYLHVKDRRYSEELKKRVGKIYRKGISVGQIANQCGVASSSVHEWIKESGGSFLRKLTVVDSLERQGEVVVALPSGVRIELRSVGQLSADFLRDLFVLGRES